MRELIAITDVTLMRGDQVCIAGVNKDLTCSGRSSKTES